LKRVSSLLLFLLPVCLMWLSCGGGNGTSTAPQTSGIKFRAFISNSVAATAGVFIINAQTDARPTVTPLSAGATPGMMVVSPNHAQTLVFSGSGTQSSDNQLTLINNAAETSATHVSLPGMTESFVISPDSSVAYIALPTAPVVGQAPGIVKVISMSSGGATGEVDIPSVHYLSISNSGNRLLGFSDNSDSVAIMTPSSVGVLNPVITVGGFDRPVAAFFSSDDTTAYVVNCGAECGGVQASVEQFDMTTNTLVANVPACIPVVGTNPIQCAGLAAGSVALVNGSTMYLAGTPYTAGVGPSAVCPAGTTQAEFCGQITIINLNTMSVINTATIPITDGYHNRIAMGANGQLFIGARTCTEIIPPVPPPTGAETRGCLSIYNTLGTAVGSVPAGGVVIPPENGDATGIQPIAKRAVVYVAQGGSLLIYDATTDGLFDNPNDSNNPGEIFGLVGQFIDVKTVDF
jgi:hypothetical protein